MTGRRTRRFGAVGRRVHAKGQVGALLALLLAASPPALAAKPDEAEPVPTPGGAAGAGGAPERAGSGPADGPEAGAQSEGGAPIVYVPPSRGRARHTAGAGTRGPTQHPPRVTVLAPRDHVGLTASAHPRLYWHLAERTATRIELTVVDDDAIEPLLELTLPGPVSAGVHALDLGELGVALEPGKTYRWFVAVVHDPLRRSRDELAEGAIERVAGADGQASSAAAGGGRRPLADPRGEALARARAGFWYDALAGLEEALSAAPGDAGLLADRAALLAQGGLPASLP